MYTVLKNIFVNIHGLLHFNEIVAEIIDPFDSLNENFGRVDWLYFS